MTAFWAIVMDTWRQSRQQVVFLLMVGLLLLVALLGTFVVKTVEVDGEDRVSLIGMDEPAVMLEDLWTATYAGTLLRDGDGLSAMGDPEMSPEERQEQLDRQLEATMKTAEAEANTSLLRRGAEMYLSFIAGLVFTVSMLVFLGVSAGYYPAMLESGAVDIVLSKPIDRLRIYLGKYVGGLVLFTLAIAGCYLVLFFGVGLRLGVWMPRVFLLLPLQVFSAAVLFAMIAAVGVYTRSSTLSLVIGYGVYIVIDSGLNALFQAQKSAALFGGEDWWFFKMVDVAGYLLPNFGQLKQAAVTSVLNMPLMEWRPVIVGGVWAVLFLGLGYFRFHRSDY